jgi:hypothetical protein
VRFQTLSVPNRRVSRRTVKYIADHLADHLADHRFEACYRFPIQSA